jgi:aldose 1-epimerase
MSARPFGHLQDGTAISEISLTTEAGASASIITRGATVRDLLIPLPPNETRRVVLGFPTLDGYLADTSYLGATAGRYASRIGGGRFQIDGALYQLSLNEGNQTHLHGGTQGFSQRSWQILSEDCASVTLCLISPDRDQGYPGTVEAHCRYCLAEPATLWIEMTATTDAPTIVNLAHHSYFSLNPGENIRGHLLRVNANHYIPVDAQLIPTGEIHAVAGTPYDFRHSRLISDPTGNPDFCYDLHFVLDREGDGLAWAATVRSPDSGLQMELYTTEPCLVFYDGAKLKSTFAGHDGRPYSKYDGLCLEPQRFPDSPNHPRFGSAVLRPGETYRQVTEYRFLARNPFI